MKNMRSFAVTYSPWTEYLPSRVRIRDNRFRKTVWVGFNDSSKDSIEDIAHEWLKKKGINTTILTEGQKGFVLLTNNFNNQIR